MLQNKKLWIGLVTSVLILTVAGCAKAPQAEVDSVRAAVTEARAHAEKWAPEAWSETKAALDAVDAELAAQEAKFAPFRSYGKTNELIAAAQAKVVEADKLATANQQQARTEAEAAVATAMTAVTDARAALDVLGTCKRKPKGFASDLEAMTGSVGALEAQLPEVQAKLDAEAYNEATSLAGALTEQATALTTELTDVRTKIGC